MPSVFPDRFAAHPKWLQGHRRKTPSGGWRPDGAMAGFVSLKQNDARR